MILFKYTSFFKILQQQITMTQGLAYKLVIKDLRIVCIVLVIKTKLNIMQELKLFYPKMLKPIPIKNRCKFEKRKLCNDPIERTKKFYF